MSVVEDGDDRFMTGARLIRTQHLIKFSSQTGTIRGRMTGTDFPVLPAIAARCSRYQFCSQQADGSRRGNRNRHGNSNHYRNGDTYPDAWVLSGCNGLRFTSHRR